MIRKNKGDFFYYLEVTEDVKIATFKKSKRAIRVNPDRSTSKTKRELYTRTVELTEDGLASFKANTSDFDHAVLLDMLNNSNIEVKEIC